MNSGDCHKNPSRFHWFTFRVWKTPETGWLVFWKNPDGLRFDGFFIETSEQIFENLYDDM